MGRHAGFLTAASSLLRKTKSDGPHLIYIPEVSFSFDKLLSDIKKCYSKYGRVIVAVSEGIQDDKKKLISQTIKKKVNLMLMVTSNCLAQVHSAIIYQIK